MFKAKKKLEDLQRKYDLLKAKCNEYQAENEDLKERLDNIGNGQRCEGEYCENCKHAIYGTTYGYKTNKGYVVGLGNPVYMCALSVPCPEFERMK